MLIFMFFIIPIAHSAPVVLYTDITSGPNNVGENNNGIYISIFGRGFGSTQGSSTVEINGTEVAAYKCWGSSCTMRGRSDFQMITVQPGSSVSTGAIEVIVSGISSNIDHTFTVRSGDIYFVATDGDNGTATKNDITKPWEGINDAYTESGFGAGDTIVVRDGTYNYNGTYMYFTKTGSSGNEIAILAYPGEDAEMRCTGNGRVFYLDTGSNADYHTVSGLDLNENGGGYSIFNIKASNDWLRIVNCAMHGITGDGGLGLVNQTGDVGYVKILGNTIYDIGTTRRNHCIYFSGSKEVEIGYNHLYDDCSGGNGIQFRDPESSSYRDQNILIHHNLLHHFGRTSILISEGSGDGLKMYNNVLYHNACSTSEGNQGGVRITTSDLFSSINIEIYNNTIYDSDSVDKDYGAWHITGVDTLLFKNNITYALSDQYYWYVPQLNIIKLE